MLERRGHTEAAVDLARLAGLAPVAVICEVLHDDGSPARLPYLELFAEEHRIAMISVDQVAEYRSAKVDTARRLDHLHQPQVEGSAGDCRSHYGAARRARGRRDDTATIRSDEHSLATLMVGREVLLTVEKEDARPNQVVLQVEGLRVKDKREHEAVAGVSFEVHAGEVLGIAGVQGNGQTELVEALTGLTRSFGGKVTLAGQEVTNATPRHLVDAGVAHVPEDRQKFGMIESYPIADNMILNTYHQEPYARRRMMNNKAIEDHASSWWRSMTCARPVSIPKAARCPAATNRSWWWRANSRARSNC